MASTDSQVAGLSTLGMRLFYGVEETKGTKPTTYHELSRINSIGGISIDVETIDASALIDTTTKSIAGRGDLGGNFTVSVNATEDTIAEWESLISAYVSAKADGKQTWFEIYHPDLDKAFFVVAEPPRQIPMPEVGQNELLVIEFTLIINDYRGMETAVLPA